MKQKVLLLYLVIQVIMAVMLFLSGFFPTKQFSNNFSSITDLPITIGNTSVNPSEVYKARIDKLIVMLIDGFRYDFISKKRITEMPYLKSSLANNNVCQLKIKVEAPTVTMPRIKALMTGDIPGFIDVLLNFHSKEVKQDNLLLQASKKGFLSVFYGDETWLKLFPNTFIRSEPTKSFFVTDFTEVDDNVTRNINKEILATDWDIMILHYLGLDHIGHVHGPYAHHVNWKLKEMDSVIEKLDKFINHMKEKSQKVVLLICSDHGMRDAGGHGGTTDPEIYVPHIFLNHKCDGKLSEYQFNQVDITTFIAFLLGLPIPSDNIGKLYYKLLMDTDSNSALYAMHYNSLHLRNLLQQYQIMDIHKDTDVLLREAENLFEYCIENNFPNEETLKAFEMYYKVQKLISHEIIKQNINYDYVSITYALILLIQVVYHLLFDSILMMTIQRLNIGVVILTIMVFVNTKLKELRGEFSLLFSEASIVYSCCLVANIIYLKPTKLKIKLLFSRNKDLFFPVFMALHLLSYMSTSFIEEEQQLWQYIFGSVLCFSIALSKRNVILLMIHCAYSKLNITWPTNHNALDYGDNHIYLLATYFGVIIIVMAWCCLKLSGPRKYGKHYLINYLVIFLLMLYTMLLSLSTGRISFPNNIKNVFPVNVSIGSLCSLYIINVLLFLLYNCMVALSNHSTRERLWEIMKIIIDTAVLTTVSLLLFVNKPKNTVIIPYILFYSTIIPKFCDHKIHRMTSCHLILGMVCFFYQGNTNDLATIDVASGIVGFNEPNILFSGFLIFINTYGAHILSVLLLFKNIYNFHRDFTEDMKCFQLLVLVSSIYMLVYAVLIVIQRNHLFIWSVFSPKLLYLSSLVFTYCIITAAVIITYIINQCLFNYINTVSPRHFALRLSRLHSITVFS